MEHNLSALQNKEKSPSLKEAVIQDFSRKCQFVELFLSY